MSAPSTPTGTDVVVIGGGAAGLTAATHVARRGGRVVLVSEGPLGGECTHTGCIPSKALLAAAARGAGFPDAMAAVRRAVAEVAATEDETALARAGVQVVRARAELAGPGSVRFDGRTLRARHVILATGSVPRIPPVPGLEALGPLTNETVFGLDRLPADLAVVGGGSVGCELAQAFACLGSRVTLLEEAPRVLPGEDGDAAEIVAQSLREAGVAVRAGARLDRVADGRRGPLLTTSAGDELRADRVLLAAGRRPVTDGLGLDRVGVRTDSRGRVVVDDTCATSVPGLWAVGDVTDAGGFTHVAAHMAFVAARNVTRRRRSIPRSRIDRRVVPRVVFTAPELAQVGLTEAEAAGRGARVAELPLARVDRAVTSGDTAGFVKLVVGPRRVLGSLGGGQVLGATIVAPRAGEMIGEVVLAMRTRMFAGRLAQATHPYPTWSTALQQAATQLFFATDGLEARPARCNQRSSVT